LTVELIINATAMSPTKYNPGDQLADPITDCGDVTDTNGVPLAVDAVPLFNLYSAVPDPNGANVECTFQLSFLVNVMSAAPAFKDDARTLSL